MRKILFLLSGSLLWLLSACVRDEGSAEEMAQRGVVAPDVITVIEGMGFDVSDLKMVEGGYLVEGDIVLTQQHIDYYMNAPKTRISQNRYRNVVGQDKLPNLRVEYTSEDFSQFDPLIPCAKAMGYWNTYSGCNVFLSDYEGEAVLRVSFRHLDTPDQLMQVTYPSPLGDPGSVVINLDCEYFPEHNSEQEMYMMLHAFGHALGFAHDPTFGDLDGGVYIKDVPQGDAESIMARATNPLSWSGFSLYDLWGFQTVYPIPLPEPDFDTMMWIQSDTKYGIALDENPFYVGQQVNFPLQIRKKGSDWHEFTGKEGMRIVNTGTGEILYSGEAQSYMFDEEGTYTLEYGAAVWQEDKKSYVCYYGATQFAVTDPFVIEFPALDQGEEIDLANSYIFSYEYDDPAWTNCTASATLYYEQTGELVELERKNSNSWTIVQFPGRGNYRIAVTVENETNRRTKERQFTIAQIPATPLYVQLFKRPVDYEKAIEYYMNFYSEEECVKPIAALYTVECHYVVWRVYHDMEGVVQSRSKQQEGTIRIPRGTSSYALPIRFAALDYLTLDGYTYEYEVECSYI